VKKTNTVDGGAFLADKQLPPLPRVVRACFDLFVPAAIRLGVPDGRVASRSLEKRVSASNLPADG
jgi:hypothetical protein